MAFKNFWTLQYFKPNAFTEKWIIFFYFIIFKQKEDKYDINESKPDLYTDAVADMTYMQPSNPLSQPISAGFNQPVGPGYGAANFDQSYQHVTLQRANQNSMQSQLYYNQSLG